MILQRHPVEVDEISLDDDENDTPDIKSIGTVENIIKSSDDMTFVRSSTSLGTKTFKKEMSVLKDEVSELQAFIEEMKKNSPGLSLNFEKLGVVKFSSDLLINLDLRFKTSSKLFGDKITVLDETLGYHTDSKLLARDLVIKRNAYLYEDSNFFVINSPLSKDLELITLRNTRVSLFWRGIILSDKNKKRIVTIGMVLLLNIILKSEAIFYIRNELPKGVYDIRIHHELNTYVVIWIEDPILKF